MKATPDLTEECLYQMLKVRATWPSDPKN